jgi:hypothetical protein
LVLLEEEILAFASGNLIHIFNTVTKEVQFRRSAGGGGIGHMTVRIFFSKSFVSFWLISASNAVLRQHPGGSFMKFTLLKLNINYNDHH